ncbi:DUF6805 domain-containing protein [Pseudoduganella namucuonensis]|uniref:Glycoside hydrolase GH146 substrate-binding domain-containing protein n=1 Tax=Pseudoduganella namucuonensis TaxID=1035707 RepID=A0A1I7H7F8_9BURK|nr:DUF6805 domain-containing protein [Pseudoduganella namucuonensis]SFU56604.1 hypothetical protein SAMN05216552_100531 [Pseudoduganella namucuonensis]
MTITNRRHFLLGASALGLLAIRPAMARDAIDTFQPGDPASEAAHAYAGELAETTHLFGRAGRLIKAGGHIEFDLRCEDRPLTLYVSYSGDAEGGLVDVRIDGELIATQRLGKEKPGGLFEAAYLVPYAYSRGRKKLRLRFNPLPKTRDPAIYGVRLA